MTRTAAIALVLLLGFAVGASEAARAPTYIEKIAIMDAFNIPGRAFASKCVKIVVSTVNPRYAYLTSPTHPPSVCVQAGQQGNGVVVFHRSSPAAVHWRRVFEGEGVPCILPPRV